jgi:quinol monooxygenase YgiN
MSKKLNVIAHFEAKDGKSEELKEFLISLIEPTLKEEGCIKYELNRDITNQNKFTFIEEWTGLDAHKQHDNTEHIKNAIEKLPDLTKSAPSVYKVEEV